MNRNLVIGFRAALVIALIAISYLAFTPVVYQDLEIVSDKVRHAAAFYVIAFLLDFALPRSRFGWWKVAATLGYGLSIEIVQYFLPWRESSFFDFLADCAGVLLYVASLPLLMRLPLLRERGRASAAG